MKQSEMPSPFNSGTVGEVITDERYWDCECDENYIHKKSIELDWNVCGYEADDSPDSRPNEIKLYFPSYKENE